MIKARYLLLPLLLIMAINGCKMGPNYSRPPESEPEVYRYDYPSAENIANMDWWQFFGDSVLVNLIYEALENNRDLRTSFYRINEALAVTGIVKADLYPRINYSGDGAARYTTEGDGVKGVGGAVIAIDYQLDIWGRFSRLNEAAIQEYLATEEAYRGITISLIGAVADSYILLRDLDNRLLISINTEKAWNDNLDIVETRHNAGMVSEVDLNQAIIQLEEARASIQQLTRLRDQTENAISVLIGSPPQAIPRGLALYDQIFPPEIPTGLPSELLDRRPDIREAERLLHAQTARIGAAEALLYPQFTITSDLGVNFALNPVLGFATLGGQMLGPIFNSGANKSQIEVEKARTMQLLNNYEQRYLLALQEVSDAMIAVNALQKEWESRQKQLDAAGNAVDLSWIRYNNGLTSYLEVLDLQRSYFSSQLKASETLQEQLNAIIGLYIALGGGWESEDNG